MSWRPSVGRLTRRICDDARRYASHTGTGHGLKSPQESIHLLRALLRECTYLPDPRARSYLSQHILSRFRVYSTTDSNDVTRKDLVVNKGFDAHLRLRSQHQGAQSALNQLRRANQGEWQPLMKVMLLTYGRIGKRRWDLMRPLLPAEGQDGEGAGKARSTSTAVDEKKPLPSLTPQLHALLLSHTRAEPPTLTRRNPTLKNLTPDVPALNSWMRPMPQSRVRNLTKKWYRDALERVLPPLPKDEWERLRGLAKGEIVEDMIVKRRSSVLQHEDGQGVSHVLEAVVAGGRVPTQRVERDIHRITPRFMRRVWQKVFVQCPLMDWDGDKERWIVVWGEYAT